MRLAVACVGIGVLVGCPADPLEEARRLEELDPAASSAAYLQAARADPANLAAWDAAVRLRCEERVDVARCLDVLDLELELLGTVQRHHDALSRALEKRARLRMKRGLLEAARSDLERAKEAGPERASVRAALAKLALMLGETSAARAALEEARMRQPDHPELEELYRLLAPPREAEASPPSAEEGFGGATPSRAP